MEHKDIVFADWHNAKFLSGLAAAKPVSPSGLGDVYWATDTQILSLTDTAGTAWVTFSGVGTVALNDLTDVTITTPTDGQALVYQTGTWINGSTALSLNTLTDVDVTGIVDNDILYYDTGTATWLVKADTFDALRNVLITSATLGDIVVFQGGQWKNLPIGANGLYLKANSAATYGIEWASGGGGSTTLASLTDVAITGQAKGDLLVSNGATDWQNLGVGTNGKILAANSAQTTGLEWITAPTSGGTNALENAWTVVPSMPMTLTAVGTSATTIYTGVSGNTTRINSVAFNADHATDPQTVKLYYWDGAANHLLAEQYIQRSGSWIFKPEHPLLFPDTYELRATSTNTSATTAVVSGGFMTTPVTGFIPTHFGDGQTGGGILDVYTVPAGKVAHLAHVIAYCYGTTGVTTGAEFKVYISDGVTSFKVIHVCFRQGEYLVFDLGITLDEGWKIQVDGDLDMVNYWADGARTA